MSTYKIMRLANKENPAELVASGTDPDCFREALRKMEEETKSPTCYAVEVGEEGYVYAVEKGKIKGLFKYPC